MGLLSRYLGQNAGGSTDSGGLGWEPSPFSQALLIRLIALEAINGQLIGAVRAQTPTAKKKNRHMHMHITQAYA